MEILTHTMQCLKTLPVMVIAGEESEVIDLVCNIFNGFDRCVLIPNGKMSEPLTVAGIEKKYLNDKNPPQLICVELNSFTPTIEKPTVIHSNTWEYSVAVTQLVRLSETYRVKIIARFPTEKRSACIGFCRRIPENINNKVRVTLLEKWGTERRLWIEGGENVGDFILYDYDSVTGIYEEKY